MNPDERLDAAQVMDEVLRQARTVLRCETIGGDDHFLDVGGDSLVAPVLARRIEERTGHRPELEDIFTLSFAEIADRVTQRLAATPGSG